MSDPAPPHDGRSLLQLAISLRLAAQRLAKSANRMHEAAQHQREQLDRLTLLRDRIIELLAVCRRIAGKHENATPTASAAPAPPPAPQPNRAAPTRAQTPRPRLPASAFVEFSNWQEFEKFRRMPPIGDHELADCNIDELIDKLNGDGCEPAH